MIAKVQQWLNNNTQALVPITFFAIRAAVGVANAQSENNPPSLVTNVNQLGPNLFCPVIAVMFWVLIAVSVIMALLAAYNYMTAGDDTEKTTKARKMLMYAAIGVVVALIANGFPGLIASLFPGVSGAYESSAVCV